MYVKSISLKNYMSFENVNISNLEKDKVYLVYGQNKDTGGSNGIGKSALLEAIPVAIYGKTLRPGLTVNSVKDLIQKGKKEMYLSIELSNNIKIERTRTKSKEEVNLIVNGKNKDIRLKSNIDEELEKYIIPFDRFKYLNYLNPITLQFFSLTPKQRIDILEDILGLNRLSELYEEYKNILNDLKIKLNSLQAKYEIVSQDIPEVEQTIRNLELEIEQVSKEQFNIKYNEILNNTKQELDRLETELTNFFRQLKGAIQEYLSTKLHEATNIEQIDSEILELKTILQKLKELEDLDKEEICPVCKRPFDKDDSKKEHIITPGQYLKENTKYESKEEIYNRLDELNKIRNLIQQHFEHKKNLENLINTVFLYHLERFANLPDTYYIEQTDIISNIVTNITKVKKVLQKLSNELSINQDIFTIDIEKELERLNSDERKKNILDNINKDIEKIVSANKEFINIQKQKLNNLNQEKELLERDINKLTGLYSDTQNIVNELSPTGEFRKFIYDKYLSKLETLIQNYIKLIYPVFDIRLEIELKGRNKGIILHIEENGVERQYGNLSSGEKRICDLAFALSLSSFGSDILIIDEALNSLSYDIKLRVIDILTKLNKQVFIVEHDSNVIENIKYLYPDKIRTLNIIKSNSVSQIVN